MPKCFFGSVCDKEGTEEGTEEITDAIAFPDRYNGKKLCKECFDKRRYMQENDKFKEDLDGEIIE